MVSKWGAAIADPCRTRILNCYYISTKVQMGLACFVYRLLAVVCRLFATVYRLPLTPCYYCHLPAGLPLALTRLLAIVYRLPALLAGAALVIAHTCVADRIAYPIWRNHTVCRDMRLESAAAAALKKMATEPDETIKLLWLSSKEKLFLSFP